MSELSTAIMAEQRPSHMQQQPWPRRPPVRRQRRHAGPSICSFQVGGSGRSDAQPRPVETRGRAGPIGREAHLRGIRTLGLHASTGRNRRPGSPRTPPQIRPGGHPAPGRCQRGGDHVGTGDRNSCAGEYSVKEYGGAGLGARATLAHSDAGRRHCQGHLKNDDGPDHAALDYEAGGPVALARGRLARSLLLPPFGGLLWA